MSRRKGRSGSSEWTERPTTTDSSLVINWMGSSFRISEKVGILPLMEFASLSAQDVDTSDMGALAAMYELLKQCIDDRDWRPLSGEFACKHHGGRRFPHPSFRAGKDNGRHGTSSKAFR